MTLNRMYHWVPEDHQRAQPDLRGPAETARSGTTRHGERTDFAGKAARKLDDPAGPSIGPSAGRRADRHPRSGPRSVTRGRSGSAHARRVAKPSRNTHPISESSTRLAGMKATIHTAAAAASPRGRNCLNTSSNFGPGAAARPPGLRRRGEGQRAYCSMIRLTSSTPRLDQVEHAGRACRNNQEPWANIIFVGRGIGQEFARPGEQRGGNSS